MTTYTVFPQDETAVPIGEGLSAHDAATMCVTASGEKTCIAFIGGIYAMLIRRPNEACWRSTIFITAKAQDLDEARNVIDQKILDYYNYNHAPANSKYVVLSDAEYRQMRECDE